MSKLTKHKRQDDSSGCLCVKTAFMASDRSAAMASVRSGRDRSGSMAAQYWLQVEDEAAWIVAAVQARNGTARPHAVNGMLFFDRA